MPKYELTYFNGRGRAEVTRYMFAIGGLEYEDNRITQEQWPALKPKSPFGHVPILQVDGVAISESMAIARFVAKQTGLAGKTPVQEALAESYSLAIEGLYQDMRLFVLGTDAAKKAELKKTFENETAPFILSKLESILSANKAGYMVGDALTWADLMVFDMREMLGTYTAVDFSKYPKVSALVSRVGSVPRVAAWKAKRPETAF